MIKRIIDFLKPYYYGTNDYFVELNLMISIKLYESYGISNIMMNIWNIIISVFHLNAYEIVSNELYVKLVQGKHTIIKKNRKGKSVGLVYQKDKIPDVTDIGLPDLCISEYRNLQVIGCSDCIIHQDKHIIVNDFAYNMDSDRFLNPHGVIRSQKKHFCVAYKKKSTQRIEKAISLCIPGAGNLYHTFYDLIFKLYVVNKYKILPDYPLLVDNSINSFVQLRELFDLINSNNREVIWIDTLRRVDVDKLAYVSSINELPIQSKNSSFIRITDYKYDIVLLKEIREHLLSFKSPKQYPSRFFISRKGFTKRQYNEEELISIAKKYSLEIVHPETMTFTEQLSLFNGADLIVGATGAAFTNTIFCNENCKSLCLMGIDIKLPIFTAGAYSANSQLIYLLGKPNVSNLIRYKNQSAFTIDCDEFEMLLKELL